VGGAPGADVGADAAPVSPARFTACPYSCSACTWRPCAVSVWARLWVTGTTAAA